MTASPVIDAYLREITAGLPGPARARGDIVAELRSGLLDAADAHRRAGLPDAAAAAAATAEFGDPHQVAKAFRPELAARLARRVALTLVATGPLIGLLWASAAAASHIAIRHAPPWDWAGTPPGSPAALPLALAAIVITAWAALLTVAATGPLTRRLPGRRHDHLRLAGQQTSQHARHAGPHPGHRRSDRQPDPAHPRQTRRPPLPGRPRITCLNRWRRAPRAGW